VSFFGSWKKCYSPFERTRFFVVIGLTCILVGFILFALGNLLGALIGVLGWCIAGVGIIFSNFAIGFARCPKCQKSPMLKYYKYKWLPLRRLTWPEQDCSYCGAVLDMRPNERTS
jgi:uncharacterized membrane protein YhaH (DUF805 family)